MTVLPFRGIWTGRRNGQRWASCSPRKRNMKSFSWEEITPVHAPCWSLAIWKSAWQRRTWMSWWTSWEQWNLAAKKTDPCPLFWPGETSGFWIMYLVLGSPLQESTWIYWSDFSKGPQGGLRDPTIQRKAKNLGCSKKTQIQIHQRLNTADEESKQVGASLYSGAPSYRTRSNGHKLKHRTFHPNTEKHFYTVRLMEHCNSLPRKMVESPSLDKINKQLDTTLSNLLWFIPNWAGVGLDKLQRCSLASAMLGFHEAARQVLSWRGTDMREHPDFSFKIIQNPSKLSDGNEV